MTEGPNFNYIVRGGVTTPPGTKLNEHENGFILSDGREIKVWESFEINTPGSDDHRDLSHDELLALGCSYEPFGTRLDAGDEA